MGIELNHTIVHASDRDATATFLDAILGRIKDRGLMSVATGMISAHGSGHR